MPLHISRGRQLIHIMESVVGWLAHPPSPPRLTKRHRNPCGSWDSLSHKALWPVKPQRDLETTHGSVQRRHRPRGRVLKKQQKLTSGKIWPQVWFPKNHSIHLIWFYFSWPFLTNQISRFQLSGSLSNIKCLLAEIEVDSTFPFLLLNQLNCWFKKTASMEMKSSTLQHILAKKPFSLPRGEQHLVGERYPPMRENLSCAVSPQTASEIGCGEPSCLKN